MIPKVIHYCWFGGNPLPEEDRKNIESWKKFCPDYEIKRWDETNYDVSKCQYMQDAYTAKTWGFVPDFARFDIVAEYGGFYFDTDVEMVKPLDGLLNEHVVMGFETGNTINGGHGFGAEAGNSVVKRLRDMYYSHHFINEDGSYNLTTSPIYITEELKKIGLKADGKEQRLDDMLILNTEAFCPKHMKTGLLSITKNTYSIHKFAGSWAEETVREHNRLRWKYSRIFGAKLGGHLYKIPYAFYVFFHDGPKAFWKKVKKKLKREK